jgi:hypothetical protein
VSPGLRWSTADFDDDPAAQAVASAAVSLNLERQVSLVRAWYAVREAEHETWGNAAFSTDKWLRLTPGELGEVEREIHEVLARWATREMPDDGQTRQPVFLFAYGVPAQP